MARAIICEGKSRVAYKFPNVNFCGVFLPLNEGISRGIVGTSGFSTRKGLVPITFQVIASPERLDADLQTIKANPHSQNGISSVGGIKKAELKLVEILVKILGDEWSGIYSRMQQRPGDSIITPGMALLPALVNSQRWGREILGVTVSTIRGWVELNALDFGLDPKEVYKRRTHGATHVVKEPINVWPFSYSDKDRKDAELEVALQLGRLHRKATG